MTLVGGGIPKVSIGQRASSIALLAGGLLLALALLLTWHLWRSYAEAARSIKTLDVFRATLIAMEKVSFERGPTNWILGEDLPLSAESKAQLEAARLNSDSALSALLVLLNESRCETCATKLAAIKQVRLDLFAARGYIDAFVLRPRVQRSARELDDAIGRMFAVIPRFSPIVDASREDIVRGSAGVLDFLQMARLSAELREQAGLLGSRFTGALGARRDLTDLAQLAIERSLGRIEQLRTLIDAGTAYGPQQTRDDWARVQQLYFDHGLNYVAVIRVMASRSDGGNPPTTGQFAAQYVPMMESIVQFRDEMLGFAEEDLLSHRNAMLGELLATVLATSSLLGVLGFMIWLFRRDLERVNLERERSRLIGELTVMAETDALTRLPNRRSFESRSMGAGAGAAPERASSYLSLVLFDIDHFKLVNDGHGHAIGDLVLQKVADLCREVWSGPGDIVARYGGEEFVVMTEAGAARDMLDKVERFRQKLASAEVRLDDDAAISVTASFGVAYARFSCRPEVQILLRHADDLLYKAKAAGRDCVRSKELTDLFGGMGGVQLALVE